MTLPLARSQIFTDRTLQGRAAHAVSDWDVEVEQQHLRHAQSIAKVGSWQYELATDRLFVSDAMLELHGLDRDGFNGWESLEHRVLEDDRPILRTATEQLIVAGLFMQFFLFGMWSVLYAYTPELYPTRSRATGAGFASAIGRIGSLLGPYIVGVLLPITGQSGIFSLGAASFCIAALVVAFLGVETKGRSLEEVSG